jgi:hypothetical protein
VAGPLAVRLGSVGPRTSEAEIHVERNERVTEAPDVVAPLAAAAVWPGWWPPAGRRRFSAPAGAARPA